MKHCSNLRADREIGDYWERQFCEMAAEIGLLFTPMQIGRNESAQAYGKNGKKWNTLTLPDVTVWTYPGQHHEIKHKNPTRFGSFGLEAYRLRALLNFARETQQDVMYTIHNHDFSGGRDSRENYLAHWLTVNVLELDGPWNYESFLSSWVNGVEKKVLQYFWPISMWVPLAEYWQVEQVQPQLAMELAL